MRLFFTSIFALVIASQAFAQSACTFAGTTSSGDLAMVCSRPTDGTCFRFAPPHPTKAPTHTVGSPVWLRFRSADVRATWASGSHLDGLRVTEVIPLDSRQWPWFGPVALLVCKAGVRPTGSME